MLKNNNKIHVLNSDCTRGTRALILPLLWHLAAAIITFFGEHKEQGMIRRKAVRGKDVSAVASPVLSCSLFVLYGSTVLART